MRSASHLAFALVVLSFTSARAEEPEPEEAPPTHTVVEAELRALYLRAASRTTATRTSP